jgi:CBS domain-containing protein
LPIRFEAMPQPPSAPEGRAMAEPSVGPLAGRALDRLVEAIERDGGEDLATVLADLGRYLQRHLAALEAEQGLVHVLIAAVLERAAEPWGHAPANESDRGLRVAALMSRVVHTGSDDDSIRETHALMRACRIRHLPIVDASGGLCGVVSDRDLLLGWARGPSARVGEVMTRHIHFVRPSTPAREAVARMLERKIGCLPVMDEEHRLVGMITETDFLELAFRALCLEEALSSCGGHQ